MSFIYRELQRKIELYLAVKQPSGLILSGIVGCGKTTLIQKILENLREKYNIYTFSGDDVRFRQSIIDDSKYIFNEVGSNSNSKLPNLVFIDEVQKCEEIFDAIKYAFDHAKISFIVSGSNPAYLSTVAKRRLQRRAEQFFMLPISLGEIAVNNKWIDFNLVNNFEQLLFHQRGIDELVPLSELTISIELKLTLDLYHKYGGLPLVFKAVNHEEKLREIRLVVERGFDLLSTENNSISEIVRVELSNLHSMEFAYKNIMDRTRIRKRDIINKNIDNLLNHGYLVKKKPILFDSAKTSYLSVFSYIDPGIVTYLNGELPKNTGSQVEGYVHARLAYLIQNTVFKSELFYFKPYVLDINGNVKFKPGEIDFVIKSGSRMVPLEVKSTQNRGDINTELLEKFVDDHKLKFGILLYAGVPFWNNKTKILFWPYWAI
jgi:predicted AAA+ superfamily ATPase